MTTTFLITSFVVVAVPGTGALFTMAAGLARGTRAAVLAAFACTLGIVPHLAAAITGLAALLQTSGVAFTILKYAGVAYLLYLAWVTWRDTGTLAIQDAPREVSTWRVIGSGIGVNLLNPKLTIFFFAFLPQFVAAGAPSEASQMLLLGLVFMAMTFVVFVGYGAAASAVREGILRRPRVMTWMRRGFAACFAGLGARLAFETR